MQIESENRDLKVKSGITLIACSVPSGTIVGDHDVAYRVVTPYCRFAGYSAPYSHFAVVLFEMNSIKKSESFSTVSM